MALGKTAFVKLCFLLSRETTVPEVVPFYDFLPYKYGPFSFTLYHEIEALSDQGLTHEDADHIGLGTGSEPRVAEARERLPRQVTEAVTAIWGR